MVLAWHKMEIKYKKRKDSFKDLQQGTERAQVRSYLDRLLILKVLPQSPKGNGNNDSHRIVIH